MEMIFNLILTALQISAVYILFSLGLTLIFGVMRIVNFAHGQYFAISALIVVYFTPWLSGAGWNPSAAYLVAGAVGITSAAILGFGTYYFGFRHFQRDMVGSFILSVGFVLLIDGILLETFGGASRSVPNIIEGSVSFLGTSITNQRLMLCIAAMGVALSLYLIIMRTKLGAALRAVSIDQEAAMLQGIPYNKIALSGFMLAAILAGIAGMLIAPVSIVTPAIGADYIVKGFIAVIIGGLGSVPGAIIGALFVAAIETFGGFYFGASTATLAIFILVIAFLLYRPKGIFGNG